MAHFHDNALIGASGQGGYQIERSLRLDSLSSAYLHRTPSTASNQKKYTISLWVKRCGLLSSALDVSFLGAGDGTTWGISGVGAFGGAYNGKVMIRNGGVNVGYWDVEFRDPSAWYHFVLAIDTDQATPANRNRLYVNGVEQPAPTASLGLGATTNINSTFIHSIGTFNLQAGPTPYVGYYTNALITEYHFIDGSQLTASTFGENDLITGVWKPKKVTGVTYGTNGFYLKFADNSNTTSTTLGKDSSGNGNNWSPVGFSVSPGAGNDSLIDTPTPYADGGNGRGNYCTLNPITSNSTGYLIPPINGNLDVSLAAGSNAFFGVVGTQAITSGKFYWEVTPTTIATSAGTWMEVGIIQSALTYPAATSIGSYNGGFAYTNDAYKARNGSYSAYGATWTANDVIGVALDADNGSITFYKNGVSQGAAYTDLAGYNLPAGYYPAIAIYRSTGTSQYAVFNFGQRAFAYTPPSGFLALNTQNLPEPTIKKPSTYFDATVYSGTAGSQSITGLGFSPNLVWIKRRNSTNSHVLQDAVRGAGKSLFSNATNGESGNSGDLITSFDSAGFTVNDTYLGGSGGGGTNASGGTFVAWCWDESATPGFDIVTYTGTGVNGQLINHNLGVTPSMIIYKCRGTPSGGTPGNWLVWHKSISQAFPTSTTFSATGFTGATLLNSTSGALTYSYDNQIGESGNTYVAYLWSEVAGFSKFGSYVGNGSSDGPFVFTGHRSRFLMVKRTDSTGNWLMYDAGRVVNNVNNTYVYANSNATENADGANGYDFLSNGFKVRNTYNDGNISSATYVFASFAENPFKYSLAR